MTRLFLCVVFYFSLVSLSAQDQSAAIGGGEAKVVTGLDITGLIGLQYRAVEKFQHSLPYMKKAHEMQPEDEEIVLALAGIYYALSEKEEHLKYMEKYKAMVNANRPE